MTAHQENEVAASESAFLTLLEQAILKQISCREAPHSQRALALLALNEGRTQTQAAEQAGLTKGQLQYWLAKFRKLRLNIFPSILVDEPDNGSEPAEVKVVSQIVDEPEPLTEKAGSIKGKQKKTEFIKIKKTKKKKKLRKKKTRKGKKGKKKKKK